MSFRGRGFRGYYPPPPLRGRGQWKSGDGASPDGGGEEDKWEERIGGGSFRGNRPPHRGNRGNFHSFTKNNGGDYPIASSLTPHDILSWLDCQPPFAVQRVMFHCQWLLHQYSGLRGEDCNNEGETVGQDEGDHEIEESPSGSWYSEVQQQHNSSLGEGPFRGGKRPSFGQHWTPDGWVTKDNSHKITSKMKPLPPQEIIPPHSKTYPEASADKEKLKMLLNNHGMMSTELNRICISFKITSLNKEDLSIYPEDQQEKLKIALNCVNNAQRTLDEYKEFLKNDKYKAWNVEQRVAYDEKVKSMIGETPKGIPYKKPKISEDTTPSEEEKALDEKEAG